MYLLTVIYGVCFKYCMQITMMNLVFECHKLKKVMVFARYDNTLPFEPFLSLALRLLKKSYTESIKMAFDLCFP